MHFPLFIAKRYLLTKSSTNAVNIITAISMFLIVVVTAVLVVVVSGFAGIKEFNLSMTSVTDPDLRVTPEQGKTFVLNAQQEKQLTHISGVAAFSKVIEERAYLEFKGKTHLALMKGVDQRYTEVHTVEDVISYGNWPDVGEPEFAIGARVATKLSIGIGDYRNLLSIMVPKPGVGQITDPTQAFKKSKAVASGIIEGGESTADLLIGNIDYVGELLGYDVDTISSIDLALTPDADEAAVREELEMLFSDGVTIRNRVELNEALHKMLNTENLMLYFVSTLILIIALFSFVGSMIMMIIDKRNTIKTLSDLGASLQEIRKAFFLQGFLIILVGACIGLVLGLIIAYLQERFALKMITATLPWPMIIEPLNILIIFLLITGLGTIAARLAASKISRQSIA